MEKQKILIADDSEMNRALLIDILEEQYDVAEAENGVEAISLLSRHRITKILVVDDEEVICQNIQIAMEETEVSVEYVLSGQAALDVLKSGEPESQPYHVVLLDWKMPGLDGIETARRIRQEISEDIPILILTSYDWEEIEEEATNVGIDAFLQKPFFRSSFRQKVDFVLNNTLRHGEAAEEEESVLQGMHILVAEDNEINAEILGELLDMVGATCDICENGELAMDAFEKSTPGQYQMILMDVQMPVMEGYTKTEPSNGAEHPYHRYDGQRLCGGYQGCAGCRHECSCCQTC